MFDLNKWIEGDHRVSVRAQMDNQSLDEAKAPAYAMTEERMRTQMAEFLRREKVQVRRLKYSTIFELELLVFTPDEFAEIVRQAASEYFMRFPRSLEPPRAASNGTEGVS